MQKRKIIIDDYDTAEHFWTLAGWSCPTPEPVTELVEVPGRIDGPLDASTALTDDIRYTSRPLEVMLETSEGTRQERQARIDELIARFHGQRVKVWGPDDAGHYLVTRLNVVPEYNDLAHAAVAVTGTCEPWKYDNEETHVGALLCGKNLINTAELSTGYSNGTTLSSLDTGIRATWAAGEFAYSTLKLLPLAMLEGKRLTLSCNIATESNAAPSVRIGYASADTIVRKSVDVLTQSGSITFDVKSPGPEYQLLILWLYSNNGTKTSELTKGDYVDYTNLQLEISDTATDYEAYVAESPKVVTLPNDRRPACPTITVQGEVNVAHNGNSYALSDGVYKLPDIVLTKGGTEVQVSGTGAAAFTYRKAVL